MPNTKRLGISLVVIVAWLATGLTAGCQLKPAAAAQSATDWSIQADYVDACNCKPACPCLYGSPPTNHSCQGATLVDIHEGRFEGVALDGVRVVAVYTGGEWIKFYVGDNASDAQADAVVKLLPTFEDFFAVSNVLEVERVPVTLSRDDDQVRFSIPNTTVELEIMRGAGGQPIRTQGLPHAGFGKALGFLDHTQYQTVTLEHRGGEQQFRHSGTTAYTARIDSADSN